MQAVPSYLSDQGRAVRGLKNRSIVACYPEKDSIRPAEAGLRFLIEHVAELCTVIALTWTVYSPPRPAESMSAIENFSNIEMNKV
jgi:hypothetical protein